MQIYAGIIGFGYMGHFHLRKSQEIDGLRVVAAYDIAQEKLADAKEAGLKPYDRLADFLAGYRQ